MDCTSRFSVIIVGAGVSGENRHRNISLLPIFRFLNTNFVKVSLCNSEFSFCTKGISAAKVLAENGVKDLLILEASDRIGGRIRKESFGGLPVELGAGWIAGVGGRESNPVWELASKLGLRTCFSDYSNARYNIYDRRSVKHFLFSFIFWFSLIPPAMEAELYISRRRGDRQIELVVNFPAREINVS